MDKLALLIIGNKSDLEENREVNEENKNDIINEHKLKIIETSAKENKNINESMIELIDKMIELGVGKIKNDEDDEDGQKLGRNNTKKKKDCCQGDGKKK